MPRTYLREDCCRGYSYAVRSFERFDDAAILPRQQSPGNDTLSDDTREVVPTIGQSFDSQITSISSRHTPHPWPRVDAPGITAGLHARGSEHTGCVASSQRFIPHPRNRDACRSVYLIRSQRRLVLCQLSNERALQGSDLCIKSLLDCWKTYVEIAMH